MDKILFANPVGYEFVEFLGEGLNSCVYKAIRQNEKLGVRLEVALKILKSEKLVSVWRNEFDRLSVIRSQHCVQMLGWELFQQHPALVLEFVDGVTLEDLTVNAKIPEEILTTIWNQAERGIRDLAQVGLFHGDLNLNNIMIDTSGCVKLVDFGIRGANNEIFTTPRFAAPEVLMGQAPNLSTDLVSLKMIAEEVRLRQKSIGAGHFISPYEKKVLSSKPQEYLAGLVCDVKRFKQSQLGLTQNVRELRKVRRSLFHSVLNLFLPILFVWPILSVGDQRVQIRRPQGQVLLRVRTMDWVYFRLNQGPGFYAPKDVSVPSDQPLVIEWKSASSSGRRRLTPKGSQPIVLNEAFFRNP